MTSAPCYWDVVKVPYSPEARVPDGLGVCGEDLGDDRHMIAPLLLNLESSGQPNDA